jgi:hypothetical protein
MLASAIWEKLNHYGCDHFYDIAVVGTLEQDLFGGSDGCFASEVLFMGDSNQQDFMEGIINGSDPSQTNYTRRVFKATRD